MDRATVEARLGALLAVEDEWYRLRAAGHGHYRLAGQDGRTAEVLLAEHWLEVSAEAPAAGDAAETPPAGVLLRRGAGDGRLRGRIYYDGFSVQLLMLTAEGVLGRASSQSGIAPVEVIALAPAAVESPLEFEAVAVDVDDSPAEGPGVRAERPPTPVVDEPPPAPQRPPAPPAAGDRAAATATCPQCGAGILPTDRFCLSCGRPLVGAMPAPDAGWAGPASTTMAAPPLPPPVAAPAPPATTVTCAGCGTPNPSEYRFCQGCGRVLRAAPPAAEPAAARPATTRCPTCSYINAAANRFCQGCGSRLTG